MEQWKFYIETFGCKINQYESQLIREAWQKKGGEETGIIREANYIIINSCAITARAERNARNAINRLRMQAPYAKIILCGCAAQFFNDFQPRKNAHFSKPDFCIAQQDKNRLLSGPALMPPNIGHAHGAGINNYYRARGVIKIQDGCSQKCSYCIVPQTRNKTQSRSACDILRECQNLAAAGTGELILSGINLRQYHNQGNFWQLLAWLDKNLHEEFGGSIRLRISSIDPAMLNEEGLETLINCQLVCPHLHLSLQHASEKILASMRRSHYKPETIINFINELKKFKPTLGLGADFIVGYPGETEDELKRLLEYLKELPITYAHVFPYSRRQGTPAAQLPNQISMKEKHKRAETVREYVQRKKILFWKQLLEQPILHIVSDMCNGQNETAQKAINEFYTPCILKNKLPLKSGILKAVPIRLLENGIEVEIQ